MVGELGGIVDPCAEASTVQSMNSISHIIPEVLKLGMLNFLIQRFGDIFEGGLVTDDWGAIKSIFVG